MTMVGFALVLVGSRPFSLVLVVCPALPCLGIFSIGLMVGNYLKIQLDPGVALTKHALILKLRPEMDRNSSSVCLHYYCTHLLKFVVRSVNECIMYIEVL